MRSKLKVTIAAIALTCCAAWAASTITSQSSSQLNSDKAITANSQAQDTLACGGKCKGGDKKPPVDKCIQSCKSENLSCSPDKKCDAKKSN